MWFYYHCRLTVLTAKKKMQVLGEMGFFQKQTLAIFVWKKLKTPYR